VFYLLILQAVNYPWSAEPMTSFNQLTSCQSRQQPRNNKSSNIDHLHKKMRTPVIPEPPVIIPNIKDQQQNRRHQKHKCGSERIISQPSRNKVHIILSKIPTPKPAQSNQHPNRLKSENKKNKNHSKNDFQAATKTQKPKSSLKPFAMKNKSPAERKTRHGKGCAGYARRQGNCVRARP